MMVGGVTQQPYLMSLIRQTVQATLNGYVQAAQVLTRIHRYIVSADMGGELMPWAHLL
jgi:hypothetical protein